MNRSKRPALRGTLLGTVLRLLNPVMRLLLGSALHWPLSRWFVLLSWTGRKSGKRYTTPVSYVLEADVLWVTTGDAWWRNLEGGAPVAVRLAGRWRNATGVALTDHEESRGEHDRLFRAHRWFRWLSGIPGDPSGGPDPQALAQAVAAGRVLVRIGLMP